MPVKIILDKKDLNHKIKMENKFDVCIYSYNSHESSEEKLNFIQDIISLPLKRISIMFIQEHFLLRSNCYNLSKSQFYLSLLTRILIVKL